MKKLFETLNDKVDEDKAKNAIEIYYITKGSSGGNEGEDDTRADAMYRIEYYSDDTETPFIAENIKSEYDTIQCRNRENINKSRQQKNNYIK